MTSDRVTQNPLSENPVTDPEDRALVLGATSGDGAALEELVGRHQGIPDEGSECCEQGVDRGFASVGVLIVQESDPYIEDCARVLADFLPGAGPVRTLWNIPAFRMVQVHAAEAAMETSAIQACRVPSGLPEDLECRILR
jgi:hypothetical protein